MYFDAQLRVYPDHGFMRTPYLQHARPEAMTIMWQTTTASVGYVEFGAGERLDRVATSPRVSATQQEVTLTGLRPDTRYFYRVHSVGADGTSGAPTVVSSPIYHFRSV